MLPPTNCPVLPPRFRLWLPLHKAAVSSFASSFYPSAQGGSHFWLLGVDSLTPAYPCLTSCNPGRDPPSSSRGRCAWPPTPIPASHWAGPVRSHVRPTWI